MFEGQPYTGRPLPPPMPNRTPARSGPPTNFYSQPGSPPRFPAGDFGPPQTGKNYGMPEPGPDVTGRSLRSGGEGLLPSQSPPPDSLLSDVGPSDRSGWEKDEQFNNAMAKMLMQWGIDQSKGEQWDDWG